ncbi:VWA domain-containing protein [Candidatus Fermentibacterales bacterium]|nr:VWA domain-containing protein [Candidatus Fermentibacterales bacterium]
MEAVIRFASWYLLLLAPIVMLAAGLRKSGTCPGQTFTGPFDVSGLRGGRQRLLHLPPVLFWLGMIMLAIALARPQSGYERLPAAGEGVDMMITLDVSSSMDATDYYPSRLGAAREAALSFIEGRPNDRIGLVIYAGEPLILCPPTSDHHTLTALIRKAGLGHLPDLTAIGSGLATAARGLSYSRTPSRVIILISDGTDTSGMIDPITVARAIQTLHADSLRVYTVAMGDPLSAEAASGYGVDRETLATIASITGGRLFDVYSAADLQEVYQAIDSLEASTLPDEGLFVFRDQYRLFLLPGLIMILLSIVLRWGPWRVVGD